MKEQIRFLEVAEALGYDVGALGATGWMSSNGWREFLRANLDSILQDAIDSGLLTKRQAGRIRRKLTMSYVQLERTWGNMASRKRALKRAWHKSERGRVRAALKRGDWEAAEASVLAVKHASALNSRGW